MRNRLTFAFVILTSVACFASHSFNGFDLKTGRDVALLRDERVTVLIFVSAKCPCSMSHAEEISALAKDFPDFRFIGINSNSNETKEMAAKYFSGFPFPVLKDEKAALADEFKAVKTPHAFILNAKGEKLFQGGVSSSSTFARAERKWLREALEDLSAKRAVRTPLARTLGCSIERP